MLRNVDKKLFSGPFPLSSIIGATPIIVPRPAPLALGTLSPEAVGVDLFSVTRATPASQNWPLANLAIFVPFGIAQPLLVTQLWLFNGAAVAGNVDVGIYDAAGNRLVSKGSTAQAGTNAIQVFDVTDTLLMPGRYYLAASSDTSGITQKVDVVTVANAGLAQACGVLQMATAFVLPATATFASFAQTVVPLMGLTVLTSF